MVSVSVSILKIQKIQPLMYLYLYLRYISKVSSPTLYLIHHGNPTGWHEWIAFRGLQLLKHPRPNPNDQIRIIQGNPSLSPRPIIIGRARARPPFPLPRSSLSSLHLAQKVSSRFRVLGRFCLRSADPSLLACGRAELSGGGCVNSNRLFARCFNLHSVVSPALADACFVVTIHLVCFIRDAAQLKLVYF